MLERGQMRSLAVLADELGMAALVEVHNHDEFALAESIGANLIGINNRDLHTFKTDLATSENLLDDYRGAALIVAESGINTPADIQRLYNAGARAFLVGESLLHGGNPREALASLMHSFDGDEARGA
jgi:indole-3-glycerol phosphate synthase